MLAMQVPFRRVHLQESNGHVDLYDTSGEQVMHWSAVHVSSTEDVVLISKPAVHNSS